MEYKVALKTRSLLGEGIWWDDRREALIWLDVLKNEVHCLKDGEDKILKTFEDSVGFCAPCEDGRIVLGCGRNLMVYDPNTGATEVLTTVDEDQANNRFNDGKAIPGGRVLAGTMNRALDYEDVEGANTGRLYLFEKGKAPVKLGSGMSVPNGIAATADHKIVYHTDTYTQTIFAYDYDEATGELTNKRPVVTIPVEEGNPDGFNIAADGTLFICHWSGHAVHRYDPATGKKIASYEVPAVHATCCCFGGKDLDELYVTTSSIDAPEEEYPLAGSIFMFKPGVKGVKVDRYKL